MNSTTNGPLQVGIYIATPELSTLRVHTAVFDRDGTLVALTGPVGCETSQCDARLFASAPELLKALEALVYYRLGVRGLGLPQAPEPKLLQFALDAIAKAAGTATHIPGAAS